MMWVTGLMALIVSFYAYWSCFGHVLVMCWSCAAFVVLFQLHRIYILHLYILKYISSTLAGFHSE